MDQIKYLQTIIFVYAHKFKNKSNKSAIFAHLKFYELPILLEWEITIVNTMLNLIFLFDFYNNWARSLNFIDNITEVYRN